MRFIFFFLLFVCIILCDTFLYNYYDFVNLNFSSNQRVVDTPHLEFPNLDLGDIVILSALCILIIHLLFIILLYCSNTFRYVRFSKNLSTLNKKTFVQIQIPEILAVHLLLLSLIHI